MILIYSGGLLCADSATAVSQVAVLHELKANYYANCGQIRGNLFITQTCKELLF